MSERIRALVAEILEAHGGNPEIAADLNRLARLVRRGTVDERGGYLVMLDRYYPLPEKGAM